MTRRAWAAALGIVFCRLCGDVMALKLPEED